MASGVFGKKTLKPPHSLYSEERLFFSMILYGSSGVLICGIVLVLICAVI
jgi:Tfp pilus assembly protein PilN